MAAPFSQSIRALEAETRGNTAASLAVGVALFGGWLAWCLLARLSVYEVGPARLEVDRAAHGVEAEISGRVIAQRLALGKDVRAGDVLVELDATTANNRLTEARARLDGIEAQLRALDEQVKLAERAAGDRRSVLAAKIGEAEAHTREIDAGAGLAKKEAARASMLREQGLLSEAELARMNADAAAKHAASQVQQAVSTRAAAELRASFAELAAEVSRLAQRRAELSAAKAEDEAAIKVVEHVIEQHRIRAPAAGKIGQMLVTPAGTMLERGARIASIVPAGKLFVVAQLAPGSTLGRVHAGQRARVRIDGFPWAEYGSVPATVAGVATEIRDGSVRVELRVTPDPGSAIPLQHGLPGSAEIEVERVSPAKLVLRATGRYLRPDTPGAEP